MFSYERKDRYQKGNSYNERAKKYEVIKKLADENGNKERAAITLRITKRHVNRLLKAYLKQGKAAFVHGNRGRKPVTTIQDETRSKIINCYRDKYSGV